MSKPEEDARKYKQRRSLHYLSNRHRYVFEMLINYLSIRVTRQIGVIWPCRRQAAHGNGPQTQCLSAGYTTLITMKTALIRGGRGLVRPTVAVEC